MSDLNVYIAFRVLMSSDNFPFPMTVVFSHLFLNSLVGYVRLLFSVSVQCQTEMFPISEFFYAYISIVCLELKAASRLGTWWRSELMLPWSDVIFKS